ncbi:MAG: F0F1 ATP synthase subunit B [Candidatus Moranbacteria bacterium]|nr:F0F1 ATP synthase subunit B [Candidatus Moranbacteria bacterium]
MSELLTKLGVDWKLLIAQIINFLVLLFVLYKFAYGPIVAMLEKRQKKIEKGLADAEEAKKKLEESEKREKEILAKARTEAREILEAARIQSEKMKTDLAEDAKIHAEKIVESAKAEIEQEKQKTISDIKSEIGGLVVAAAEKVVGEKMNDKKDKEIINHILNTD